MLKAKGGEHARAEGVPESRSGEEDAKILQPTTTDTVETLSLFMSKFNL
jgi:hypothetical protein